MWRKSSANSAAQTNSATLCRSFPNQKCRFSSTNPRPTKTRIDKGGKSHHSKAMPTTTLERPRQKHRLTVLEHYDVAADAKKRISLRRARTKYFHVKALSNGCYLLEPRVLVSPGPFPPVP